MTETLGRWLNALAGQRSSGVTEIEKKFSVPLEDKLALLTAADETMRAESAVKVTKAHCGFHRERKWFGSSEGAFTEQSFFESGAGIVA